VGRDASKRGATLLRAVSLETPTAGFVARRWQNLKRLTIMILSRKPHSRHALVGEILARSSAREWHDAKREWKLSRIFISEPHDLGTCLCGHFPIREHCVLVNRETGAEVVVGNVCVKRFLELDFEELFAAFRKIMKSREAALSPKAIDHVHEKGWINEWERTFYLNTWRIPRARRSPIQRRRILSPNQLETRVKINEKIVGRLTEREGRGHA
jgi:hypothetical protein